MKLTDLQQSQAKLQGWISRAEHDLAWHLSNDEPAAAADVRAWLDQCTVDLERVEAAITSMEHPDMPQTPTTLNHHRVQVLRAHGAGYELAEGAAVWAALDDGLSVDDVAALTGIDVDHLRAKIVTDAVLA